MQISGHKTRSVLERYNIVSEGDLREAASKVAAVSFENAEPRSHNLNPDTRPITWRSRALPGRDPHTGKSV
jgi:hypothetical protein